MNKPVIAITGATGFIGCELNNLLFANGYRTIRLVRNKERVDTSTAERHFDLNEDFNSTVLNDAEVLIHCAYDFKDSPEKHINLRASKRLIDAANLAGIKKIIFISTVTAHKDTVSFYGRSKLEQETLFDVERDVIIKSSLVIGNGGLFKRLFLHVMKNKYIPLINRGRTPLQVISIGDLKTAVLGIIEKDLRGQFILANNEKYSYRSFFKKLAAHTGRKIVFLNINLFLLKVAVKFLHFFGIRSAVSSENIKGLESMIYMDPAESLMQLDLQPESLEHALDTMSL